MHWKENTALTTSGEVEMKEKIMEESNITAATSAMSQTSSVTSTSSVISVVADVHQADDSESIVPSSSQCLADPLPLCPSLSDGGGVSYDAEDTVDPHCVVDLEENVSDSGSLRQNVLIAPVTSTDYVVIGSSSASSPPSLSQSVSSTQSGTEVGHSVSDSLSSSSAAVEEASVVPLGVALTNSFNSISAAAVDISLGPLVNSVDPLNASDSAVETDDSFQEEMVIDAKDIKQEADSEVEDSRQDVDSECEDIKQEIDSEGEDTVDGHVLNHLQDINLKAEADSSSNSSCSLKVGIWESDASMRQRLFNTMSQSFPGSALSRILHSVDTMATDSEDEEFAPTDDRLCSSCFGSISLDKEDNGDLTSLEWLQKDDLLKDMSPDLGTISEEQKENAERQKSGDSEGGSFVPQPHPSNVPYNPQKHVNAKPPFSFSCLIFMAVEESPGKKLPVKDIYNWILTNFPYYQNAPVGWKNSVRHNLSLNKCFKKVEKDKGANIGKGSLWCIDPEHRPNLLQALRKTPYHPYQQLQMMSSMVPQQVQHVQGLASLRTMPLTQRPVPNSVPPHLFPFLSRRLAQTNRVEAQIEAGTSQAEAMDALAVAGILREAEERLASMDKGLDVCTRFLKKAEQEEAEEKDRDVANILLSMGSKNTSARSAHSCENGLLALAAAADHLEALPEDSSGMSSDASDASGPTYLGSKMKRKAGPPKRQGPHIITPYPNPEHSYSSPKILEEDTISGESSIDNEYDFGGEDDVSELSNYPSDWDETSGDEVDGDLPQPPPSKRARLDTEDMTVQRGAQLLMNLYHLQPGASSDTKEDEEMSPEKSSPPCSKSLPRSTKFQRSSSASPLSRKRSSTAATKSSSLSSSLSSSTSSSSSVKKTKPKPVSRSTLKTKLFPKKSANSAAASKKSLSNVSSKTAGPSKSVGASGSKTAAHASTSSSSSKKSELSKTPEASKKLDSAATPPSAKPASTPVSSAKPSSASSSTPKASIIMTRRGKAAAELAAAAKAAAELGTTSDASASATEMDTSASGTKPNAASASQTKSETSVSGTKSGASASQSKSGVVTAVHRMRTRGKKLSFS